MKVALLWPFGRHRPGEVIDCDPTLGQVLVREGFAADADGVAVPPQPKNPTVAELREAAKSQHITLDEAKQRAAAERASRRQGANP